MGERTESGTADVAQLLKFSAKILMHFSWLKTAVSDPYGMYNTLYIGCNKGFPFFL